MAFYTVNSARRLLAVPPARPSRTVISARPGRPKQLRDQTATQALPAALVQGAVSLWTGVKFLSPGLATAAVTLAARAVVEKADGWSEQQAGRRLFSLLDSKLGAVLVPTLLAVGKAMNKSLAVGRLETVFVSAMGTVAVLGLHVGLRRSRLRGGRDDFEREAALPLAAVGTAVGCGLWNLMLGVARVSLSV